MRTRIGLFAAISAIAFTSFSGSAFGQTASSTTAAPGSPAPWTSWKKVPIPPLPAFHPKQPTKITLKNGMTIFLQEDHELPFINGFIMIRGGSRDEPADKTGLTDLYAEAWRTSGTTDMTGDKMDDILEAKAAKIETNNDIESTGLTWTSFKQDFDQVFGMATNLLLHPEFRADKLALAKQQEDTGIIRRNDDPEEIAEREAELLAYGKNSPYARVPEFATVHAVTLADLTAWHDRTVTPNNMILGISGDFNTAEMETKLRAAFETLPHGPDFVSVKTTFPGPMPGIYLAQKGDVNQSNVWIVGLGTERSNPDYYALSVMNTMFSGGFGSRLFQDVRTRLGLAYAIDGAYGASYDHPGLFYVAAGTKSASTVAATQAMLKQIDELKTVPPSAVELRNAKDQVLNSWIFHFDSPEKILRQQATLAFFGYPSDFIEKYRDGIEKVTAADVTRVADKYIHPSKLAILVVGNQVQFGTPLSTLGPVKTLDISIPMPPGMQQQMGPQ
ncbi:MAG TPA: pitrilysin family protein [Acidobacteriaceae bacterium]|nr:pitrilysin family protein [Acidobacteriaceae bacterium]